MKSPPHIRDARNLALKSGATHYEGGPCGKCKCTKRYTANGQCVACVTLMNAASKQKHRDKIYKGGKYTKHGDGVREKAFRATKLKEWPVMRGLEDITPGYNDTVGKYSAVYHQAAHTGCSASETAEW